MKKINSIGYAHKIVGFIGLFLVVIPLVCFILFSILHLDLLITLMYVSLTVGLLTLIFFIGLLILEFHQDKQREQQYIKMKKTRLSLGNGFYECQFCGNRHVEETNKNCGVCGMEFTIESNDGKMNKGR